MAKSSAYTKHIKPIGAKNGKNNPSEDNSVHQTSPAWVLTFVRWNVRDTLRAVAANGNSPELNQVRPPLVVENDCVALSVSSSKGVLTPSMQATLLETDVNYATAIAPGDFVFVNMLNWKEDARRIVNIARSKETGAINGIKDGFKGVFKVQSVRKKIVTDENGTKRVYVAITGFAFTEFNNTIYYNPYLRRDNQGTDKDNLLFATNLQSDYGKLITPDKNPDCQDLIRLLIQSFIGNGISDQGQTVTDGTVITANTHFTIPQQVGKFLGVSSATAAKDVYNYVFGIQKYSGSAGTTLASGMNPSNLKSAEGRFYYTSDPCVGQSLLRAEYWNQQKAWAIINQYTNAPLNELFTCFRIAPNGKVMPTVVYRQIPFSTDHVDEEPFNVTALTTKFLNLPRWKIHPALIIGVDLGRDEAARINFVQYYATPPTDVGKENAYMSVQTAAGNYVHDVNDVMRSGLRPLVVTTSFQDLTIANNKYIGKICANILGDAIIGEHLKLNGTLECAGIVDPIAVGDNLEYDGNVYHIEEVNHMCSVSPDNGVTMFRTVVRLSHGVDARDSKSGPTYAEMQHTVAYQDRKDNYVNGDRTLPGVSEEQEVTYRPNSPVPTKKEVERKDSPFAQPGQKIIPIKDEDNE